MTTRKKAKHPGGRPRHEGPDRRDTQVAVRLDADTIRRLDALAKRSRVPLTRTRIVYGCLSLGLDVAEQDFGRLFEPARKGKR